jgi:hypothetical protein
MKRLYAIAIVLGLLSVPAFGQAIQPETDQRAAAAGSDPAQLRQLQQRITSLYLSDFRNSVELTEEQFIQLEPVIRQFIQMRFERANQRELLKQRQEFLLNQTEPSDGDVKQLAEDQANFERQTANQESRFIERLRSAAELSPRQALLVPRFNRAFFDERLPQIIERAREAAAAPRGQPQRPAAARGNANRGREPARSGNAFGSPATRQQRR